MLDMIMNFLNQYPIILKIVALMGTARLIFKPLMVAIQSYVASTETVADDAFVDKLKNSSIYKGIAFILDYAASIKLPAAQPKA